MTEIKEHQQDVHDHEHDHDHAHDHEHDHDHDHHDHEHGGGWWTQIATALHLPGYAHEHASLSGDATILNNELGIRTVRLALLALGITTIIQVIIYLASGSVALLGDTVHNLGDALNSIPLWVAYVLARRAPDRRYTYGLKRAEDVAGLFIVGSIAFSAVYILIESISKLVHPEPVTNLPWVVAAAIIGFLGNEAVALMQIRVGRKIGSEAMVADGLHARTDGLTSLSVLVAVAGIVVGFPILDPIIGILMSILIMFIARNAIIGMWYRLMDAVDPKLIDQAEAVILKHTEIKGIYRLQMRWLGHALYAEAVLSVDPNYKVTDVESLTDHISHELYHAIPNLGDSTLAIVPQSDSGERLFWRESAHHRSLAPQSKEGKA